MNKGVSNAVLQNMPFLKFPKIPSLASVKSVKNWHISAVHIFYCNFTLHNFKVAGNASSVAW